jgi:hypothetical protein
LKEGECQVSRGRTGIGQRQVYGQEALKLSLSGGEALDLGELLEVGAEDFALQGETGELALAPDVDEAGVLELLDVVGEGGGADVVGSLQGAAGHGVCAGADLAQDLVASRLGQGAGDRGELPFGQVRWGLRCHCFKSTP